MRYEPTTRNHGIVSTRMEINFRKNVLRARVRDVIHARDMQIVEDNGKNQIETTIKRNDKNALSVVGRCGNVNKTCMRPVHINILILLRGRITHCVCHLMCNPFVVFCLFLIFSMNGIVVHVRRFINVSFFFCLFEFEIHS